jgi:hypothetical protein
MTMKGSLRAMLGLYEWRGTRYYSRQASSCDSWTCALADRCLFSDKHKRVLVSRTGPWSACDMRSCVPRFALSVLPPITCWAMTWISRGKARWPQYGNRPTSLNRGVVTGCFTCQLNRGNQNTRWGELGCGRHRDKDRPWRIKPSALHLSLKHTLLTDQKERGKAGAFSHRSETHLSTPCELYVVIIP